MTATRDRDYVLGTHDEEIARLGVQHRAWRPRVLDAWRRANWGPGQTILDIGCGPGYAAVDLAGVVGPSGRVVAIDRSRRFLDALEATRRTRGLDHITTLELDLDEADVPVAGADGAWCRWILAFVKHPRDLVARLGDALKPGGVLVLHEYLDYGTWRLMPTCDEFEEFVGLVIDSWRASGGEPNIGRDLPGWLECFGFEITVQPIIDVVRPEDGLWQWPRAFVDVGLGRLVDLGYLTPERSADIWGKFLTREAAPDARMVTPLVLEIMALKR